MMVRRLVYSHADYISQKYFFVHIHELPDGKRREILKKAAEQLAVKYHAYFKMDMGQDKRHDRFHTGRF